MGNLTELAVLGGFRLFELYNSIPSAEQIRQSAEPIVQRAQAEIQRAAEVIQNALGNKPISAEKLEKLSAKVKAANDQIEELKKSILKIFVNDAPAKPITLVDRRELDLAISDIEYKSQKALIGLGKLKDRARDQCKAHKKTLKVAVEGLFDLIAKEGVKQLSHLQEEVKKKIASIRESREPHHLDIVEVEMLMSELNQTESAISSAQTRIDHLRKEILKA